MERSASDGDLDVLRNRLTDVEAQDGRPDQVVVALADPSRDLDNMDGDLRAVCGDELLPGALPDQPRLVVADRSQDDSKCGNNGSRDGVENVWVFDPIQNGNQMIRSLCSLRSC
jgi:hypothetical protein